MYKFQGFKTGDRIRAEDFEGRPERGSCHVEGVIQEVNLQGTWSQQFAHYLIKVTRDIWGGESVKQGSRVGTLVAVPMQTSSDWDRRVTSINA